MDLCFCLIIITNEKQCCLKLSTKMMTRTSRDCSFGGLVWMWRRTACGGAWQRPGSPVYIRRSWWRVVRVVGQVRWDSCVVADTGASTWVVVVMAHWMRRRRSGNVRVKVSTRVGPIRRCWWKYATCSRCYSRCVRWNEV